MATESTNETTEYAHIVCTPGVLGGSPRIDGHRIRVLDVALARDLGGYSPEEIAATVYPSVTLAEVYAALAYYEDHRADIDGVVECERSAAEQFLAAHPNIVRDIRAKPTKG